MADSSELNVFIGYDGREAVATYVAEHSIRRRTTSNLNIKHLKHRELRRSGLFSRPWLMKSDTGDYEDLIDSRPFTTEFSHTRFLIPELMKFQGWALFFDADMIFTSDIKQLFKLCNDKFAVMCVKHNHRPPENQIKMDNRLQNIYRRKNWSSFVLWNCNHPSNKKLTKEKVNFMRGGDLHAFSWLQDHEIGDLPPIYNYISGVSPPMPMNGNGIRVIPDVIHYTEGGPWFEQYQDVPYAKLWRDEFESWSKNGGSEVYQTNIPSMAFEDEERIRKK